MPEEYPETPEAPYLPGFEVNPENSSMNYLNNFRILMIDNFDSFTYNLMHYLNQLKGQVEVVRNDFEGLNEEDFVRMFDLIVLSPGPMDPYKSGQLTSFIQKFDREKPMLGICLGMQALGICNGAKLVQAPEPRHGKTSKIDTVPHPVFDGIKAPFSAMRYHSLALDLSNTEAWQVLAYSEDQVPMIAVHSEKPLGGVQFHPESILTSFGFELLANMANFLVNRQSSKLSRPVLRI